MLGRGANPDQADVLDEHDPYIRVRRLGAVVAVALDVRLVLVPEDRGPLADAVH